jgi:DNA (cytosine-5)-methyltransferase 1
LIKILFNNSFKNEIKMIDLFAGTGAFSLAFEATNKIDIVFANDMIEYSKKIYDDNFNHKLILKNINEIKNEDIPAHDILTAGFPCQPFSIAGLQEGFKDERSNVFWKILSIIDYHKPKCVILENVKNLISHDENRTFTTIKNNLEQRGYYICYKVLNTAKITGIPQHRERVYIVCIKSKKIFDKFNLDFPEIEKKKIIDFLENDIPTKYYYNDKSKIWELLKINVIKNDTIYQYRRVYVRENKKKECPTLTANMGSGGHNIPIILDNIGIRKLTPRECFNFQGFPSSYKLPSISDCNLYKLAGNAVSLPIVKLIANRIIPLLEED